LINYILTENKPICYVKLMDL